MEADKKSLINLLGELLATLQLPANQVYQIYLLEPIVSRTKFYLAQIENPTSKQGAD